MSNEKPTAPHSTSIVGAQSYDTKMMGSSTRDAIFSIKEEMHEMLQQLSPEDMAKIDHIEINWLSARIFPKS